MKRDELSFGVIGCCMQVHSALGQGLLELCYHNALYYELRDAGFAVKANVPYTVKYKGRIVGEYFADLVVNNQVIIELKAVQSLSKAHLAQVINYLHISGCGLGLLVNFQGPSLEWKRVVV